MSGNVIELIEFQMDLCNHISDLIDVNGSLAQSIN